jgi:predicted nucleotidyltransferase component of viral defense system
VDDLQALLTREGLRALTPYGFALAGGFALQAHGLVDRLSEDVDLFTDQWDAHRFAEAVSAARAAFEHAGLEVEVGQQAETFARLYVLDAQGQRASVDLAADPRSTPPAQMSIGPVLSEVDAVGSKVAALFSRSEARDYLDVAGILASGR